MHRPRSTGKTMADWKNSRHGPPTAEGWKNMCTGDGRYVAISLPCLPFSVNRGRAPGLECNSVTPCLPSPHNAARTYVAHAARRLAHMSMCQPRHHFGRHRRHRRRRFRQDQVVLSRTHVRCCLDSRHGFPTRIPELS